MCLFNVCVSDRSRDMRLWPVSGLQGQLLRQNMRVPARTKLHWGKRSKHLNVKGRSIDKVIRENAKMVLLITLTICLWIFVINCVHKSILCRSTELCRFKQPKSNIILNMYVKFIQTCLYMTRNRLSIEKFVESLRAFHNI